MTLQELKERISENAVPDRRYSLNDGIKIGAYILINNYGTWEYFYLDEKGNREDNRFFSSDSQAFEFLWKKLEYALSIMRQKKIS